MKQSAANTLKDLYKEALAALQAVSDAIIEDTDENTAVPFLLLEAGYAFACFSRAVRASGQDKNLRDQLRQLRRLMTDSAALMAGNGEKRLSAFCADFFSAEQIAARNASLRKTADRCVAQGTLDDALQDEEFEEDVFELFLMFDRFFCLAHPGDSPLKRVRAFLSKQSAGVQQSFDRMRGLFSLFAGRIAAYRAAALIPVENQYSYWMIPAVPSTDQFLAAFSKTVAARNLPQTKDVFALLLKKVPRPLRVKIESLKIPPRIGSLTGTLTRYNKQAGEFIAALGHVLKTPQPEPSAAYFGEHRTDYAASGAAAIRMRYHDSLKALPPLIKKSRALTPAQKRDLLIVAFVLLDDQEQLKKLLAPQKASG